MNEAKGALRIAVVGGTGQVGRCLLRLIAQNPQKFALVGVYVKPDSSLLGRLVTEHIDDVKGPPFSPELRFTPLDELRVNKPEVVIDFSTPEGLLSTARAVAAGLKIPIVTGTTGLTAEQDSELLHLSKTSPILRASNFSFGVNLLEELAFRAASVLRADDFDCEIIDVHHRRKKDAPSGTAVSIANRLTQHPDRKCQQLGKEVISERYISKEPRIPGEVYMQSLRMGGVVGEHTVSFCSERECIKLTHQALNRDIFAEGALKAACWFAQQDRPPRMYTLREMFQELLL